MQRALVLASLLSLALTACSGSSPSKAISTAAPASVTPPAPVQASGSATPASTEALPRLRLDRAFPNLSFQRLTGMYQGPDSRMYVLEQRGRILAFDNRPDVSRADSFLDISDRVDASSEEMGLLGLALAPDFARSGVFYVDYTAANPRRTVISRFVRAAGQQTADPKSEQVILEVNQPFTNHKGGQIIFGPDGDLYLGFGDGGSADDPMRNGQNKDVLLGKLLRIDVSGTSEGRAYRVPSDNPFAGQPNTRDEIYAYGLRNPWRFSFDSQTGQLWIGDVGQGAREEIDIGAKGANYGWNIMEGTICRPGGPSTCDRTGLTLPVLDYPTAAPNCAVTGGFVYRGAAIPALRGAYVYADYCGGRVSALRYDGAKVTGQAVLATSKLMISTFATDSQGELYVLDHSGGGIYKLLAQ